MLQTSRRIRPEGGLTPPRAPRTDLVLRVTGGPYKGREREVPRDRSFTLGRSEEADFPLVEGKISRIHAVIEFRDGDWVLEDLGSRNGTWIGERKIKKHTLADGDTFLLGRSIPIQATMRRAAPAKAPAAAAAADPGAVPLPAAELQESLEPLTGALVGLPGTNLGEFRILEQVQPLGQAAFFRALQPSLNRHVMVEVFTDEEMDHAGGAEVLRKSVQQAARLLHPNILQIYDLGRARGFTYVTMEFFQGRNLGKVLSDKGFVPIGRALALAEALCEALGAAIDAGVPAGTVSPADVWVDPAFAPKVKFFREPGSPPPAPAVCAYQAPEVLGGGDATEPRAAVYAAGAILYHMLAATPPLAGATREELARRARHDTPAPLRRANIKVTPLLAKAVEQCLAKDPKARPDGLRAFARELRRATAPTL